MTAQSIQFRKRRHRTLAEQRAAEIDAQIRQHFAAAFRNNRDAGLLVVWLDDSDRGRMALPFHFETQERIYL